MRSLDFKMERDELAKRLGGSLPQSALCLIEGGSGTGKSVVSQRLTYGLLHHDIDVAYISTEFTTTSFLHQMDQLGYPVMDEFIENRLKFVSTHPQLGHPVPTRQLLPRLLKARPLLQNPVVVVDAFSQLAEPHLDPGPEGEQVLEHLVHTLKRINSTGTTLILTIDPSHFEGLDTAALTSAADIRIECTMERVGGQVNRFLVNKKFARAQGTVGDVVPFRVEPGAGFIVEIKAVA